MTQPNLLTEENFNIVRLLSQKKKQDPEKFKLFNPLIASQDFGPMMQSPKLWRTNDDIRVAVDLWCSNRDEAEERYGHISDWVVSSVTDMSKLFESKSKFNDDITRWDVSNVTDMHRMFEYASAFNQPIGNWDVSKVTDMSLMFIFATAFNQPIGNWDVSNVTYMYNMFQLAVAFNQPIGQWNVSKVTDMAQMFDSAISFNQPIENWNVSNVIYMSAMFVRAEAFNQYLGKWDVSKVTDIRFNDTKSFNEYTWSLEDTSLRQMFGGAISMEKKNLPGRRWWKLLGGSKQTRRIQRKSNKTHSIKGKHSKKQKQIKKRGARKTRRG
jgi:surface protein